MYYSHEKKEVVLDYNPIAEANQIREELMVLEDSFKRYDELVTELQNEFVQTSSMRDALKKQIEGKNKLLEYLNNDSMRQCDKCKKYIFGHGDGKCTCNFDNLRRALFPKSEYLDVPTEIIVCSHCGSEICDCGTDMIPESEYKEKKKVAEQENFYNNPDKKTEIIEMIPEHLKINYKCLRNFCGNEPSRQITNPRFLKFSSNKPVFLCEEHFKEKYPGAR